MVELEGMDLSGSETCPLSLAREITPRKVSSWSMLLLLRIIFYQITPRSDKLRSQGRGELLVSLCHQVTRSLLKRSYHQGHQQTNKHKTNKQTNQTTTKNNNKKTGKRGTPGLSLPPGDQITLEKIISSRPSTNKQIVGLLLKCVLKWR